MDNLSVGKMDKRPLLRPHSMDCAGTMDNLSVGKIDKMPPLRPHSMDCAGTVDNLSVGKIDKMPLLQPHSMDSVGTMDNLSVGTMDEMPQLQPHSKPPMIPRGPFDVRSTFVCSIRLSLKQLYKRFQVKQSPTNQPTTTDEQAHANQPTTTNNQAFSSKQFSMATVRLSNNKICFYSPLNFSSSQIYVMVPTNEPISFRIPLRGFMTGLKGMSVRKEIHRVYISYQAENKLLIIEDAQSKMSIMTFPSTKKRNKLVASS